jgi:hypothetical protein
MRFGMWNVMSLYRSGSLTTVARELARYKLDLVGIQEVRWDKWGTDKAGDYIFFFGKGNKNHQLETEFMVHDKMASLFKRVEFVSDRVLHIVLSGHWCHVLNVHVPSEEKSGVSKDVFLRMVFDHFPKYHMKILFRSFNAKFGREDTFKLTIWKESLHQDSNDNGDTILTLTHQKT